MSFRSNLTFVDSELSCAVARDKQKEETIDHRQLALVHDGEKSAWEMLHEIRYGHLAAGDEGGKTRQQTKQDQNSASELNNSRG